MGTLVYNPTVRRGSVYYTLPLPLNETRESFAVAVQTQKVPLVAGVRVTGVSRDAMTVSFSGIIVKDTHAELLAEKNLLMQYLIKTPTTALTFYRYYDPANAYYRWYQNCYVQNLTFDHTTRTVHHLPYSFDLVVPDGLEYVSGTYPDSEEGGDDALPDDEEVLYGPLVVKLSDASGSSGVIIMNSDGDIVAKITSDGNIEVTGEIIQTASITDL